MLTTSTSVLAAAVLATLFFLGDVSPGPAGCCGGASGVTPEQVDQSAEADEANDEASTPTEARSEDETEATQ